MLINKIYGENIEQGALDQFASALEQDFTVRGALMADAHQGYSLPIGGVVATRDFVLPSWVGYDIGCGMCALPTTFDAKEIGDRGREIHQEILKRIPVGFKHNERPVEADLDTGLLTPVGQAIFEQKQGFKQLGTLGGGNHFIEIAANEAGDVWIVIHSGSRGVGHGIAQHYMKTASPTGKASEGHFGFEVDSSEGQEYLMDQLFCLRFALENRREIMRRIVAAIEANGVTGNASWDHLINRNHNHVQGRRDFDGKDIWVHRKGATHAEKGMMGVIPGNMRDGSFIVCGKGDAESLWSSSHGAGRVLGRKAAKQNLDAREFELTMQNVIAGEISANTLDESPMAYKNIIDVMGAQRDLVEVVTHVRPIINVKG